MNLKFYLQSKLFLKKSSLTEKKSKAKTNS